MTFEEKDEALAPYMMQLQNIAYILDDVPVGIREELLQEAQYEAFYRHCQRNGIPDDFGNPLPPLTDDKKVIYVTYNMIGVEKTVMYVFVANAAVHPLLSSGQ